MHVDCLDEFCSAVIWYVVNNDGTIWMNNMNMIDSAYCGSPSIVMIVDSCLLPGKPTSQKDDLGEEPHFRGDCQDMLCYRVVASIIPGECPLGGSFHRAAETGPSLRCERPKKANGRGTSSS